MRYANHTLAPMLAHCTPVANHGHSLSGEGLYVLSGLPTTGDLPEQFATELTDGQMAQTEAYMRDGTREHPDLPAFIVRSYATPIAWRLHSGTWMVPMVRYSLATAKHLSLLLSAIAQNGAAPVHYISASAAPDGWLMRSDGWISRTRADQAATYGARQGGF